MRPVAKGVPHLNHLFVIMMEIHGYSQIVGNPNAPFINEYREHANVGRNYFAVAPLDQLSGNRWRVQFAS